MSVRKANVYMPHGWRIFPPTPPRWTVYADMDNKTEVEAKWLMKEGADVGQSAAEAFAQWAKQEHLLDNMTRSWERAFVLESSDSAEASHYDEHVLSASVESH